MAGTEETAKFEALAPTLRWMPRWVRENLSPRAVWWLLTAIVSCTTWITRETIHGADLERANIQLKSSQEASVHELNTSVHELNVSVHELDTKVAVMLTKVDDIGHRVDEQQEKWDLAEDTAEHFHVPRRKEHKQH